MRFGAVPVAAAEGAILAHGMTVGRLVLKKGRVLRASDLAALAAAGVAEVTVARLDSQDVAEDVAAAQLARAVVGGEDMTLAVGLRLSSAVTGRANLIAGVPGLLVVDVDRLNRLNQIDEALTVATLPPFAMVAAGDLVATVKIIPFGVAGTLLVRAEAIAAEAPPLVRVASFRPTTAALIQTRLPGTRDSVLDKTVVVTKQRLGALGATLVSECRCPHTVSAVAAAVASAQGGGVGLVLIVGASAITDRADVVPAGIVAAGGTLEHLGMPVDPGNLLLLARLGEGPVFGLPGCARSSQLNGFDWLLRRKVAGLKVTSADIMVLGVGGLLGDSPSRPAPRALPPGAEPANGPTGGGGDLGRRAFGADGDG